MNRQERRAARRRQPELVSIMVGQPDPECECCRMLGLLPKDVVAHPDRGGDGSGSEAVFTSFPPTP